MISKDKDGRLVIDEIPFVREDGSFVINGGTFHVAPGDPLYDALADEYKRHPRLFQQSTNRQTVTTIEKKAAVLAERDARLAASDSLMIEDRPWTDEQKKEIRMYRALLRALPEQPGFPWDGGGPETPWPVLDLKKK